MDWYDKQQVRAAMKELRALWNEHDPIGVVGEPGAPLDEYDAYAGQTLTLLRKGATEVEIVEYLEYVETYMGLEFQRRRAEQFGRRLKQWFDEKGQS